MLFEDYIDLVPLFIDAFLLLSYKYFITFIYFIITIVLGGGDGVFVCDTMDVEVKEQFV